MPEAVEERKHPPVPLGQQTSPLLDPAHLRLLPDAAERPSRDIRPLRRIPAKELVVARRLVDARAHRDEMALASF